MFTPCLKQFMLYLKTCLRHVWRHIYTMFENRLITYFYHVRKHVKQCMNALYTNVGDLFTPCLMEYLHYVEIHVYTRLMAFCNKCLKPYSFKLLNDKSYENLLNKSWLCINLRTYAQILCLFFITFLIFLFFLSFPISPTLAIYPTFPF